MKKLPIGIQTFQKIREDDYVYVDKTGIAVDLINRYQYVFLSRPRRFGKSLFLDTLHNIFEGKKELFIGLAAETSHDWSRTYPVIKVEFSEGNFRSKEALRLSIMSAIMENEKRLGVCAKSPEPSLRFPQLIREAARKNKTQVVILIDEYDKPILDNMDQPEMAVLAREELKALYSGIKSNDAHIRFTFLTGVTKFFKVSVFSGINNIVDISLEKPYGTICGYTQNDLETVFAKHLEDADMEQVKLWYDGYSFMGDHVYNPFDILLFIAREKEFKSYWFETATPTFLIKLLKKQNVFLPDLNNIKAGEELLTSFDIENISPVTLLFQAGYLTIREVRRKGTFVSYILGFPNLEVSAAFTNSLLDLFSETFRRNEIQGNIYSSLEDRDMEGFKSAIHALFAAIPYHNYTNNDIARYEGFYASVIFAWLSSAQLSLLVEDCTNKGRIDMSVEMDDTIYLIEFKVDMPEEKALAQIKANGYAEKYQAKDKKIVLIGIGFSSEEKNVTEFIWEGACH
ncbi:MAG: hypothetical protein CSA26_00115 [Desulfobacterales bacterium]|nr:MAG: hypothetical protein CSA26_00115 [Desulfobacterales bacterium]